MFNSIGDLPPIHWLTHLGMWQWPFFEWLGGLFSSLFTQDALQWVEGRGAWLLIATIALTALTLEMAWWSWSWLRGRQIGYSNERAEFWTSGPRKGQRKENPINIKKAKIRSYAWPYVGLPLYLVAVGMYAWYLMWPGEASRIFLALLWCVFTPARRTLSIAVARKAYLANNPGCTLDTTVSQDVYNYFVTGVARPEAKRRLIDPPFEGTSRFYRLLNWGHRVFGRYGTFWRIWRFWNFLRFWGLLVQLAAAFLWPVAVLAAPFFYMWGVQDYQKWVNPWWRRYRKSESKPGQLVSLKKAEAKAGN